MFPEVDPVLGPEMRSTGEVLGLASTFGEAFYKSQEATQTPLPLGGTALLSISDRDKDELVDLGRQLIDAGFEIIATRGTRDALVEAGIPATLTLKASEGRPNVIDLITNGDADLIINTPSTTTKSADDGSAMRRAAIKAHAAYMTTMAAGFAAAKGVKALRANGKSDLKSLQEIHAGIR
jgi:carbamoyl-phosphate synthase large subunit